MDKMRYVLIFLVLIFTKGCKICDRIPNIKTIIENKSYKEITIYFYHNGIKNHEFILLKKDERIENIFFKCDTRIFYKNISPQVIETFGGSGQYGSKFPIDSISVVFDSLKVLRHISFNNKSINPFAININDPRNIFNFDSYNVKKTIDEKCRLEVEAIYTFSEMDYSNANNFRKTP